MAETENNTPTLFEDMLLDERILKAIADLGWKKPTLVQKRAIPLALEGKDIIARACTGSGKTGAFSLPLIQKILQRKKASGKQAVRALILTPTKELSTQIIDHLQKLCVFCSREIRFVNLSSQTADVESQKPTLATLPDVIVSTPNKILAHLKAGSLDFSKTLEFLVVDEADLLLSFGYEEEMRAILPYLSKSYQAFLTSATMNDQVKTLKKLLLRNPVTLKLTAAYLPSSSQLVQYHIKCEEEDKFILLYALLKLRLIKGRFIIFVSTIDRCYRLKLFLEQFAIQTCILNSEMPSNSRCHIVQQFNEGMYDIIISADETSVQKLPGSTKKKKLLKIRDPESGIVRGIDFHNVANVINFDFPKTVDDYVHRVGRTARGFDEGTALSFITPSDHKAFKKINEILSHQTGEEIFKPYHFRMEELDGFKYRARDAYRAVTSTAVKDARLKDIKEEIMKSEKLKSYFAENPRDLNMLLHDKELRTIKIQPHLQHVPDYIVPPSLQGANYSAPLTSRKRKFNADNNRKMSKSQKKFMKKKMNPLESFQL